jgi:hypothetical protein
MDFQLFYLLKHTCYHWMEHLWYIQVGCFAPQILPLHKLQSFVSASDRAHLLTSSSNVLIHVFFGLPVDPLSFTFIRVHLFIQSSSPVSPHAQNHLNIFLLYTSTIGSTPILALSSVLRILSLNDMPHIISTFLFLLLPA